jgi:hypothetical protein
MTGDKKKTIVGLLAFNPLWVEIQYSELKVWGGGGSGEGKLDSDKRFAGSRVEDREMQVHIK